MMKGWWEIERKREKKADREERQAEGGRQVHEDERGRWDGMKQKHTKLCPYCCSAQ